MKKRMIQYVRPNETGGNSKFIISEETAIELQKARGVHKGLLYASDEEALDDFMIINWAWRL